MRYDTVIFDLDGTLLNTIDDLADGVNYCMRKFGLKEHSVDQVRQFVGNGIRKLMERAIPGGETHPEFETIFEPFKEYYTAHCRIKTKAYPGIEEMLKTLKDKTVKMAIVSNKNMDAVRELNEIYFSEYISLAVGDTAGVRRKPYPDSVLHAMQLLDSRKEHTVYVGDSEVDKETAENAGMDYVLVSWGFRGREYLEKLGASCIIDRPEELISMLEIAKEK